MNFISLLPVLLLIHVAAHGVAEPRLTFEDTDPISGKPVECDRCPPGTFLLTRCTATHRSVCEDCPPGSFTELWNHISKCLRCGVCGHNQVVKAECTTHNDCQCVCKDGYFYKETHGMCRRHSECPTGHGVLSAGTVDEDTVCQICPNDTFSDVVSSQMNCTVHRSCEAAGLKQVLKGSSWHDSVCTSSTDLQTRDGADYLKEILPTYFIHHKLSLRRLRHVVRRLRSGDGRKPGGNVSGLDVSELHAQLNTWISSATAAQIRQLPDILVKTGANNAGEKLRNKLQKVDSHLPGLCASDNLGAVVLLSE